MKDFLYETLKFVWKRTLGKIYWGCVSWNASRAELRKKRTADLAIRRAAAANRPLRVVIGASDKFQDGWVPTDINNLNILDQNDWDKYFTESSIDAILAEHVWEHLTMKEAFAGARNCFRYLKRGGYARIAVPDGFNPDADYIQAVKPGGTGDGSDDHKTLYDHSSLTKVFETAGFKVRLLEYFDASGRFNYVDWDQETGLIRRSMRFDERNATGVLKYSSLIIDAIKL